MPGTIDDFMNLFTSGGPIDDWEVEQYHEDVSTEYNQIYHQSATEYLRKLPEDEFQQAARKAVSQAAPEQRQRLLGSLLGALEGAAGGQADIANLNLGFTDPNRMSEDDAARLLNYALRKHPKLLTKTLEENPWFVKALDNGVVVGALAITAKRLSAQRR